MRGRSHDWWQPKAHSGRRCGHRFCRDCIKTWVSTSIKEHTPIIKCPGDACSVVIENNDVRNIADEEDYERFQQMCRADYTAHLADVLRMVETDPAVKTMMSTCVICPNCHVIVQRSHGCNHMHCRMCNADFNHEENKL